MLEKPGKIVLIVKSRFEGHFLDRDVLLLKEPLGLVYLDVNIVLVGGHGGVRLEYLIEA
jgi:hypothetical protein